MKPINFVTRGKQSDFGMYFVGIGMVFYLSSSSRIIQKAMFRFPVTELRLRCWKKMGHLTRHLPGCKSVSKQEQVAQNLTCEKCGQIFTTKKSKERHQRRAEYCTKQQEKIAAGEEVTMYQYRYCSDCSQDFVCSCFEIFYGLESIIVCNRKKKENVFLM